MPLPPGGPSPPVEVAPGVFVFTSRREHTTSTLVVGSGSNALLVDPAWEPDELAAIAANIAGRSVVVKAGFATHAHYDHVLWHPKFGAAPRYASAATVARVARERKALVAAMGPAWPPKLAKLVGRLEPPPSDGLLLGAEPIELITHDAHLPGHTALWLEHRRVLIAGDLLSDVEPPLPYYDDDVTDRAQLVAYLAGLDALAPYVARTDRLIPGHGTPTDRPMVRLDADRRHIDALLDSP
jgi:glyoxylase-like metal-dependent hydrolase (beta-lactamase superfamily II)